jgi:2-aminoadipate transaminase
MELPSDIDVMKLFDIANKKNVAFVPGAPFYISNEENPNSTLRLNYTNSELDDIRNGICSLVEAIASFRR